MGTKKIKVPKKSAVQTDDAVGFLEQVQDWAQANLWPIVGGLLGVLVISIVYLGFNVYQESREGDAQAEYVKVMKQWPNEEELSDSEKYDKLIPELQNVIQKHKGTKTALDAQLDLAKVLLQAKRYEDALKWGETTLGEISPAHPWAMLVHYHLAIAYEGLDKSDKAIAEWEGMKASASPGLKKEIHWRLAQIYAKQEKYPKAVEEYEKALEVPGGYPSQAFLEEKLALAKEKVEPSPQKAKEDS